MENRTMPIRVLIIASDWLPTRTNLEKCLTDQEKFQIVGSTTSGLDGLKIAEEGNPDVVFINDILDNYVNPFDILQQIKDVQPNSKFVLTMRAANPQWLREAVTAGADSFVMEPLSKDEVIRTIQHVLQEKQDNR